MLRSSFSKTHIEAGCDEAGRGCLAGPVVAAAVVLPKKYRHKLLNDSKQLTRPERDLLRSEDVTTAIIFCNRKTTVRELNKSLQSHGFASGEIHGDMEQPARLAELGRFKEGKINILVASDVAARGLDIKGVSHVFNFDTPWHPDDYVHRIGRTGRAGAG